MSETLRLDPARTALVLIEYQNDFTSPGVVLHGAVSEVMAKTGMLANTVALSPASQATGKIRVITTERLFGEAIARIHRADSLSSLFV